LYKVLTSAYAAKLPTFFFSLFLVSLMNFRTLSKSALVDFSNFSFTKTYLSTSAMSWSVMDFCLLLLGVSLLASAVLLLVVLDALLCCMTVFVFVLVAA